MRKIIAGLLAMLLALVLVLSACSTLEEDQESQQTVVVQELDEQQVETVDESNKSTGLIDFTSIGHENDFIIDEEARTITIKKVGGDHMAIYNGLEEPSLAFVFEADIMFPDGADGIRSAALTFGIRDKNNPFGAWYGANLDSNKINDQNLFRLFGVGVPAFETHEGGPKGNIDIDKPLHLKLEMKKNGKFTYSFGNVGTTLSSFTGVVPEWAGGYVGILAWECSATFSNVSFESLASANYAIDVDWDAPEEGDDNPVLEGLTDFSTSTPNPELVDVDETTGTVTVGNTGGDHFVVYNGLLAPTNSFVFEADVELLEASAPGAGISGALIFGLETTDIPSFKWYGANFDTGREDPTKFRVFAAGNASGVNTSNGGEQGEIDFTKPLHLKIDVRRNGAYIYTFGNAGEELTRTISGVIPKWEGGYLGILSFNSKVRFSNISLKNRCASSDGGEAVGTPISGEGFNSNLENLASFGGTWSVSSSGLTAANTGLSNCFAYSSAECSDFVYSTEVTSTDDEGTISLVFRNQSESNHSNAFALTLDLGYDTARLTRWENNRKVTLVNDKAVIRPVDGKYTLKVVSVGIWMLCYVNDQLVASTGDYTMGYDAGQNTIPKNGYFGLECSDCTAVFQNTNFTALTDENTPVLQDLSVMSSVGDVEKKTQFFNTTPTLMQYVKNDAVAVDISAEPICSSATVTVTGPDGVVYDGGKGIPVAEGKNLITVTSSTTVDGVTVPVTYHVMVLRRQEDGVYYKESFRNQYHYSVKDGWGNDPNGLVYFNGTWHLFVQYGPNTVWGDLQWYHETSKDLIHWEDQGIAIIPSAYGWAYSGCCVADPNNTSGLFSTDNGGLVMFITSHGEGRGERIELAYSEDEGKTWIKTDKIVVDWSTDPLHDMACRDPKVFRWENTWFMVIAGGPLRIYSSQNLIDWTCESTYIGEGGINTECPDLYPVYADDGNVKWVLSRGGRTYKIGDFMQVDGRWTFVPDDEYKISNGIMNFGRDSYAAMTWYIQDFGTAENPTLPDILEINWMNTWDYCNEVARATGSKFNGNYNLILKLGVTLENGKYVLTQSPINEYTTLRNEPVVNLQGQVIGTENEVLSGLNSDTYEVLAHIKLSADTTKVGFRLRENGDKYTQILYDVKDSVLSIDRSKSGIQVGNFADGGRITLTPNADGTIDLHIFVDRASVEVFANGGVAAGADMIFPDSDCLGASMIVEGGDVTADITVYTLNSIWN